MTAVTVDGRVVRPIGTSSPLRALAEVEALRFARHPLFLVTVALVARSAWLEHSDSYAQDHSALEQALGPVFLLGLGGMLVAYRLTRSTRRAEDAVAGVPSDEPTRTAALLLACLVPFTVAVAAMANIVVVWHLDPSTWSTGWASFTATERDAMMVAAALAGLGGPVLGVCLGRWWRWPGAPLVATVGLVAWSILTLAPLDSRWGNAWHMSAPFVLWVTGSDSDPTPGVLGGSPVWRVGYVLALIGLAATAAMLHGSAGSVRGRLQRLLALLAAAAVALLVVASVSGPTLVQLAA
jgi:hypothetical protein